MIKKNNTCTFSLLLKPYIYNGIIDSDTIINLGKEDSMRFILEKVHPYKISKVNERYVTYVTDNTKPNGRRQIRKKSLSDLYEYLLSRYQIKDYPDKEQMKFNELFFEWIEYKKKFVDAKNISRRLSPSTIRRYERDYDKHIKNTLLSDTMIGGITPVLLEENLIEIIKKGNMYPSFAKNLIGYIKNVFLYAYRKRYISENPIEFIDISLIISFCKEKKIKTDNERTLTISEMQSLYSSIYAHKQKYPNYMPDYAIELAMFTGMRVGELSVLKYSDIYDGYIHITKSEHRNDYSDRTSELVVGRTKNSKIRQIPLTKEIEGLMRQIEGINKGSEYLFSYNGRRYTSHDISCAVTRRGEECGIKNVSIHEIRRTVSSMLDKKGLPRKTIANLLGHLEETNEEYYQYDVTDNIDKIEALSNVSSSVINIFPK